MWQRYARRGAARKRRVMLTGLLCVVLCALAAGVAPLGALAGAEPAPVKKIAYLEKGRFWLFSRSYAALRDVLDRCPDFRFDYPQHLHKSPGWNVSDARMDATASQLLASDADIIIAAGTGAVNALLRVANGEKPIVGMALADPVMSGLMTEDGAPRNSSFTAEVFPERWRSMYRVFHNVVKFRTLGIMYPKGPEGRVYAAVDDAYAMARQQGFDIVEAVIPDESPASCAAGVDALHRKGADSFFISPLVCFDWSEHNPSALLQHIHHYKMPTFARDGSLFVQGGALMGFATWDFSPSANRLAEAVRQILRGTPPADIRMIVAPEPRISINLQAAQELGISFPFDVLLVADEIYEKTVVPRME